MQATQPFLSYNTRPLNAAVLSMLLLLMGSGCQSGVGLQMKSSQGGQQPGGNKQPAAAINMNREPTDSREGGGVCGQKRKPGVGNAPQAKRGKPGQGSGLKQKPDDSDTKAVAFIAEVALPESLPREVSLELSAEAMEKPCLEKHSHVLSKLCALAAKYPEVFAHLLVLADLADEKGSVDLADEKGSVRKMLADGGKARLCDLLVEANYLNQEENSYTLPQLVIKALRQPDEELKHIIEAQKYTIIKSLTCLTLQDRRFHSSQLKIIDQSTGCLLHYPHVKAILRLTEEEALVRWIKEHLCVGEMGTIPSSCFWSTPFLRVVWGQLLKNYVRSQQLKEGGFCAEIMCLVHRFDEIISAMRLGIAHSNNKEYAEGAKHFQSALSYYQHESVYGDKPHVHVADCFFNLGSSQRAQGKYKNAAPWYNKALSMYYSLQSQSSKFYVHIARCLLHLGMCKKHQRNYAGAEALYNKALSMYKNSTYSQKPRVDVANCLYNLGVCQAAQGGHENAASSYNKALSMYKHESVYGNKPHVSVAKCLCDLGSNQICQEEYEKAKERLRAALDMLHLLPTNTPELQSMKQDCEQKIQLCTQKKLHAAQSTSSTQ